MATGLDEAVSTPGIRIDPVAGRTRDALLIVQDLNGNA